MFEALELDLNRSVRYQHHLSVLMMDLDHFKKVNDQYGHAAGDSILREFAERVSHGLRSTDALCRYGGEEFSAVLPETPACQAATVAENIRQLVLSLPFTHEDQKIPMTVSIGVATFVPGEQPSAAALLDRADKALYDAKNSGRNRVCSFHADDASEVPLAQAG
jgi:diguanylate cyclase (GGDEF)-like protein